MKHFTAHHLFLVICGLIICIVLIVGGIALTIRSAQKNNIPESTSKQSFAGDATLSFSPNIVSGKKIQENIVYDGDTNTTSHIVVIVTFDPKKVTNVQLTQFKDPSSALSYSLETDTTLSSVDSKNGAATLILNLAKGATAQKGRGIVAKLTADIVSSPTSIVLAPESAAINASDQPLNLGRVNLEIQ